MENIRTVLEAAGATLYDVVKCTVFLDDMEDYWPMNEVYASFWDGPPPARSAFGADGLALGALLEIECIARDPVIE
jgi:enamine deaminase RidA (YjgF/YER057c/UK114 family)